MTAVSPPHAHQRARRAASRLRGSFCLLLVSADCGYRPPPETGAIAGPITIDFVGAEPRVFEVSVQLASSVSVHTRDGELSIEDIRANPIPQTPLIMSLDHDDGGPATTLDLSKPPTSTLAGSLSGLDSPGEEVRLLTFTPQGEIQGAIEIQWLTGAYVDWTDRDAEIVMTLEITEQ